MDNSRSEAENSNVGQGPNAPHEETRQSQVLVFASVPPVQADSRREPESGQGEQPGDLAAHLLIENAKPP
jgi:hypothetical protein